LKQHPVAVGAIFRDLSGRRYSRFTLPDNFVAVARRIFPGDQQTLADMRRSGAMDVRAGISDPATLSARMADAISCSTALHKAYMPAEIAAVRRSRQGPHALAPSSAIHHTS